MTVQGRQLSMRRSLACHIFIGMTLQAGISKEKNMVLTTAQSSARNADILTLNDATVLSKIHLVKLHLQLGHAGWGIMSKIINVPVVTYQKPR